MEVQSIMSSTGPVDVYREWLGIKDGVPPFDYYQLLRLERFDDDQVRIRRHYRKLNSHVRKYSTSDYAQQSQQLLNELARAMLCLTDLQRKEEYDLSLGHKQARAGRRDKLADILLEGDSVSREQLEIASQYADSVGLSLRDALMQKNVAPAEIIMQAHARSVGLPFLNLSDVIIDESLLPKISAVLARTHSLVPIMIENEQLLLASPNLLDLQLEEDLKLRLGTSIRMVLCTPADINQLIGQHYTREAAEAELVSRSDAIEEGAETSGLAKTWSKIKKWIEENNKK